MSGILRVGRVVVGLALGCSLAVPAVARVGHPAGQSAWEQVLDERPEMATDESISPLERRILHSLTPDQARAFFAGADAQSLVLADGSTLADLISTSGTGQGMVYVPVDACRLAATFFAGGKMGANEIRGFAARGDDLSAQGGSATGCGIPPEAVAVVTQLRISQPDGLGYLKGWPSGAPETVTQLVDYTPTGENLKFNSASILELCVGSLCSTDFTLKTTDAGAHVRVDTVGYFRAIEVSDIPGGEGSGLDADTLDGLDSTDFAAAVHTHAGEEIVSGTVAEARIDGAIARDAEVFGLVTAADGSGSGLDADLLDGQDSTAFAPVAHTHDGSAIVSGIVGATFIDSLIARDTEVFPIVLASDGPGSGLNADLLDGLNSTNFAPANHTHDGSAIVSGTVAEPRIAAALARDTEVFGLVLASDGSGSGLDADLLDGLDSTEISRRLGNIVSVGKSGGEFTSIQAALDSIVDAAADNPYRVSVGPGIYNEQVTMKPFVSIAGAGQLATKITLSGLSPTVIASNAATLSNLTVLNEGGVANAVAINVNGTTPTLRELTASVSGGSVQNIAIRVIGAAAPKLFGVTARSTGVPQPAGIVAQDTAVVEVRNSTADGGTGPAMINLGGSAVTRVANTQLLGSQTVGGTGFVCVAAFNAGFVELGTNCL